MYNEAVKKATAAALKTWRENAGLSQAAVAKRLGTTQATVSRWENGTATPDANDVVVLAAVYEVAEPLAGLSQAITTAQKFLRKEE